MGQPLSLLNDLKCTFYLKIRSNIFITSKHLTTNKITPIDRKGTITNDNFIKPII